jgi:hypothetical protein
MELAFLLVPDPDQLAVKKLRKISHFTSFIFFFVVAFVGTYLAIDRPPDGTVSDSGNILHIC